ncbi:unnamed protein product [Symbiodinium sp. CCMP2592]|nr:unnamed protein product [Symbiodinium sp. CCMP2592]
MGKPWQHGKGKGHRDNGMGLLHGIARRFQEQQQLSMLGPMRASAGFGQPAYPAMGHCQPNQIPVQTAASLPQPFAAMPKPSTVSFPVNAHPQFSQMCFAGIPAQSAYPHEVAGHDAPSGSASSVMSAISALTGSVQKLVSQFAGTSGKDSQTKADSEAHASEHAQKAMAGEPTELLHDLLRLAKRGIETSESKTDRKRGKGKNDGDALSSIIEAVLNPTPDEDETQQVLDDDTKEFLAKRLAKAVSDGTLAFPKKRARKTAES